jgi:hypothetical protein
MSSLPLLGSGLQFSNAGCFPSSGTLPQSQQLSLAALYTVQVIVAHATLAQVSKLIYQYSLLLFVLSKIEISLF